MNRLIEQPNESYGRLIRNNELKRMKRGGEITESEARKEIKRYLMSGEENEKDALSQGFLLGVLGRIGLNKNNCGKKSGTTVKMKGRPGDEVCWSNLNIRRCKMREGKGLC